MTLLCRVLEVSRSGYYQYVKSHDEPPSRFSDEVKETAKEVFESSDGSYGSRRMSKALRALSFNVGRYQARTLMSELGLEVNPSKRFKVTTDSKHKLSVADNHLNREFDVKEPNKVWGTDITYLWTNEGWLYLAIVIDLYSRKVVGWSMSKRMTTKLVKDALKMAVWQRRPGEGLLHHSDRGSQYASHEYQKELKRHGMICSMSRKGNCWDNSVVERFFRSLKGERTDKYIYVTRAAARAAVVDYIRFYNQQRLHSYLDYCSPNQYEQETLAMAA